MSTLESVLLVVCVWNVLMPLGLLSLKSFSNLENRVNRITSFPRLISMFS